MDKNLLKAIKSTKRNTILFKEFVNSNFTHTKVTGCYYWKIDTPSISIIHLTKNESNTLISSKADGLFCSLCLSSQASPTNEINNFVEIQSIEPVEDGILVHTTLADGSYISLLDLWRMNNMDIVRNFYQQNSQHRPYDEDASNDAIVDSITKIVIMQLVHALFVLNSNSQPMLYMNPGDIMIEFNENASTLTYSANGVSYELEAYGLVAKIIVNKYTHGTFSIGGEFVSIAQKHFLPPMGLMNRVIGWASSLVSNKTAEYTDEFDLGFFMNTILHYGKTSSGAFNTAYNPYMNIVVYQYMNAVRQNRAISNSPAPNEQNIVNSIMYSLYQSSYVNSMFKLESMYDFMHPEKDLIKPEQLIKFISSFNMTQSKSNWDGINVERQYNLVISDKQVAKTSYDNSTKNMMEFYGHTLEKLFSGDKTLQTLYLDEAGVCFLEDTKKLTKNSPFWIAGGQNGQVFSGYYDTGDAKIPIAIKKVQLDNLDSALSCPTFGKNNIQCEELVNESHVSAIVSQLYDQNISPHFVKIYSIFTCDTDSSYTSAKKSKLELVHNKKKRGGMISQITGYLKSMVVSSEKPNLFLVMEKMNGDMGDLESMVAKFQLYYSNKSLPCPSFDEYLNNVVAQVCIALMQFHQYFHGMHNDLHMGNIFLKICDETLYDSKPIKDHTDFVFKNDKLKCKIANIGILAKIGDLGLSFVKVKKGNYDKLEPLKDDDTNQIIFSRYDNSSVVKNSLLSLLDSTSGLNNDEKRLLQGIKEVSSPMKDNSLISGIVGLGASKRSTIFKPTLDFNMFMRNLCINKSTYNSPIVAEYKAMINNDNLNDDTYSNQKLLATAVLYVKNIKHGGLSTYLALGLNFTLTPEEFLLRSNALKKYVTAT